MMKEEVGRCPIDEGMINNSRNVRVDIHAEM